MKTLNLIHGLVLLAWLLITITLGLSYRWFPNIPTHWHPQMSLFIMPLILFFHWMMTKKTLSRISSLSKNEFKEIQTKLYSIIIIGSLTYIVGLAFRVGFIPFMYHQIIAYLFILMILQRCYQLIIKQKL